MEQINNAISDILRFLSSIPLSEKSIKNVERHYRISLIPYCKRNGVELFTDQEKRLYVNELIDMEKSGELSRDYLWRRKKVSSLLADRTHGRKLFWTYHCEEPPVLSDGFTAAFDRRGEVSDC